MAWLIVLLPLVSACVLCAWRGLPRALPVAASALSALLALGGLARGVGSGVGWPWPLPVLLDVPRGGDQPAGWIDLGAWQPSPGLLLDPISLVVAALASVVFAACAAQASRWRVAPATLARGLGIQACVVAAALANDLLLGVGCLLAASLWAGWQREGDVASGRWVLGALTCLVGAATLALGRGSALTQLASAGAPPLGCLLVLGGLVALRRARVARPRDPAAAGLGEACADTAASLGLVVVLTRLWPTLASAAGPRSLLVWGAVVVIVVAAAGSLRAASPSRAARGVADATLAGIVLMVAAGAPTAGALLGCVAAPALAGLHLSLAGLLRDRPGPDPLRGAKRARPAPALALLLVGALLCGLPPWGVHRAWAGLIDALLAAEWVTVLIAALLASALLVWALARLVLWPWAREPGARPSSSAPRPWPLLILTVLAALLASWLAPAAPAWAPDAVAARLLGRAPAAVSAETTWAAFGLALLPVAVGLALAGSGIAVARQPAGAAVAGRRLQRGWSRLGAWALRLDARASAGAQAFGSRGLAWWGREDPPAAEPAAASLQVAYRDAALVGGVALIALALGVWLG